MARIDTLGHFLTDVASAIKTKKSDETPILASDFDTEIENLPSGGEDTESEMRKLDIEYKLYTNFQLRISERNYTQQEVQKTEDLITNFESIMEEV